MRKRIVGSAAAQARSKVSGSWLDLEHLATVEVSSEDPDFPIESVFHAAGGPGWRAAGRGEQQIRIVFDQPVSIARIHLRFDETEVERIQEFTIRWESSEGGPEKEIVRQQWNFSPTGSTIEVEDYTIDLNAVSVLELAIQPDVARREAVASLAACLLA